MQCEKFEARLQDLLDQRERPELDARLLDHAETCDNCRETLALQERLFTGLELFEPPALSEAFAARVVARHQADLPTTAHASQSQRLMWRLFAGMLAASVLVAVVTFAMRERPAALEPTSEIAEQTPPQSLAPSIVQAAPQPAPLPPTPVAPRPDVLLQNRLALQFVGTAPEFLDGQATGRMIREVTTSFPEVAVMEENIPGIRPITSSFSLTIGMVRRTLPGGQENTERAAPKPQTPVKPQAELSRPIVGMIA